MMRTEQKHGVDLSDLRVGIHGDGENYCSGNADGATSRRRHSNRSRLPCNPPEAMKASYRQLKRRSSCIDKHSPVDKPKKNTVSQEVDVVASQRNDHVRRRTELESLQENPLIIEHITRGKWPRLLIPLSRKEKEDDFMVMKGSRLPQRPKKRAKHVEKIVSYISPGTFYYDLTRDRYEVKGEKQHLKKKSTGLRAMESMDTDSE